MTAYTWIGGTGNWNVASNWSPGSPARTAEGDGHCNHQRDRGGPIK